MYKNMFVVYALISNTVLYTGKALYDMFLVIEGFYYLMEESETKANRYSNVMSIVVEAYEVYLECAT